MIVLGLLRRALVNFDSDLGLFILGGVVVLADLMWNRRIPGINGSMNPPMVRIPNV